jgi:predicted O-methyltransferase YrrM
MRSSSLPFFPRIVTAATNRFIACGERLKERAVLKRVRSVVGPVAGTIKSFTSRAELCTLFELASSGPKGAVIVEIGSYLGASACFLGAAAVLNEGSLICVDTWHNETMPEGVSDTWEIFRQNVSRFKSVVTTIRQDSMTLNGDRFPPAVWMAFIDGDHSVAAARHDSLIVADRVVEGGIIAFHDAIWFPGVAVVIGELLASGEWQIGGLVANLLWLQKSSRNGKIQ